MKYARQILNFSTTFFGFNPYYKGLISDHFDGKRFHNYSTTTPEPTGWQTLKWTIKWLITATRPSRPNFLLPKTKPKLSNTIKGDKSVVTYLSHATALIQAGGLNILTDPVWSNSVGPVSWIGKKRICKMPVSIKDLPPIDIVLISHNHYDHLDIPTLKKLVALYKPKIFAGLGVDSYLKTKGLRATGMDWWDSTNVGDAIALTYTPSQHWSSRWIFDKNFTLWGSFTIDVKGFGQIYFGGDTGYNETYLNQIRNKFPNIRLALLPIGSYKPRWFMSYVHIDPDEAVKAATTLRSQTNIAIHYDVFLLASEEHGEAPKDLAVALQAHNKRPEYFKAIKPGESISLNLG